MDKDTREMMKRKKFKIDKVLMQNHLYINYNKSIKEVLSMYKYTYGQYYYYCKKYDISEKLTEACPVIRAKLILRSIDGSGKCPSEDVRELIADTGHKLTEKPTTYKKLKMIRKNINNPDWVKAHRTGRFINPSQLIGNEPWEVREYINTRAYKDITEMYIRDEGNNYLWV